MENETIKKALLVFGSGFLLFLLLKPKKGNWKSFYEGGAIPEDKPEERKKLQEPKVDPKELKGNKKAQDGITVLKAYISAYNSGEPQRELDKLNEEIKKEYKLQVFRRGIDNKIVVADLSGKVIIENKE
jgi:hypothetical protein